MHKQTTTQPAAIPAGLFKILARQVQLSEEFLHILKDEQRALRTMDSTALHRLIAGKNQGLAKLLSMDESLKECMRQLLHAAPDTEVQLSDLAALAGPGEAERLNRYRLQLNDLRREILGRNLVNRQFTNDTLGYLGDAVALLAGAPAAPDSYGKPAGPRPAAPGPNLISREV